MKSYSVVFVVPREGKKPDIVLTSLLEHSYPIDWSKSAIVHDFGKPSGLTKKLALRGIKSLVSSQKDLSDVAPAIESLAPDFIISCGWGQKIPLSLLKSPSIAALNCHSSYLPDYKGGSVYQHYWANLEPYGGATVHIMTDRFDAGNIICQEKFRIFRHDTPNSILHRASELTAPLIREAIQLCASGYKGTPHQGGRYFLKISTKKLLRYRIYNRVATFFGFKPCLTPHR